MSIIISAIICTHNRAKYLPDSIRSLAGQSLQKESYEIIIVDNASADRTREVVCDDFADIENLVYIFEPQLGLSKARNTGWLSAQGQYVAYLDDDAVCRPDWLERIVTAFQSFPEVGVVGGRVRPKWEVTPPAWLDEEMAKYVSAIDWSEEPVLLSDSQYLVGANIAYRSDFYARLGGFCLELGRKGKNLVSSEETDFTNKIKNLGYSIYYDPDIEVEHFIPRERLSVRYFIRRAYSQGVSDAIIYCHRTGPDRAEISDVFGTIKNLAVSTLMVAIPGCFRKKFPDFLVNLRAFARLLAIAKMRRTGEI